MGKPKVTNVAPGNETKSAADVAGSNVSLSGPIGSPQTDPAMTVNVKAPAAQAVKEAVCKKRSDVTDELTTYFKEPSERREAWKSTDDCPGDV